MTPAEQAIQYQVIGMAEKEGIGEEMRHYHAELQILHAAAKAKGERHEAAFMLALGLFSLEVQP